MDQSPIYLLNLQGVVDNRGGVMETRVVDKVINKGHKNEIGIGDTKVNGGVRIVALE